MLGAALSLLPLCTFIVILSFDNQGKQFSRAANTSTIAPLPVSSTFNESCIRQRNRNPSLRCSTHDDSFIPLQCILDKCFCVNSRTGLRISDQTYPRDDENQINCNRARICTEGVCSVACHSGQVLSSDQCKTCVCQASFPQCLNIKNYVAISKCTCRCVVEPSTHGLVNLGRPGITVSPIACPTCSSTCNSSVLFSKSECSNFSPSECIIGNALIMEGLFGRSTCSNYLSDGERCVGVDENHYFQDQQRHITSSILNYILTPSGRPCGGGLVCRAQQLDSYICKKQANGPCVRARESDPKFDCDPEGFFQPIQCQVLEDRTTACRCVNPLTGIAIFGSEKRITYHSDKPVCSNTQNGLMACLVTGVRAAELKTFHVAHGRKYFNFGMCRTCQCINGNAMAFCSQQGSCERILSRRATDYVPSNCMSEDGTEVKHMQKRTFGCNVCSCRDGKLGCTKKSRVECQKVQEQSDVCDRCSEEPASPVCGPDGRTHHSICSAIRCAGIPAVDLKSGSCASQSGCDDYPCDDDMVCINTKGKVACLGRINCYPQHLRRCISRTEIQCHVEEEANLTTLQSPQAICGTDGNTYQSICDLIQTATRIGVLYAGKCNATDCPEQKVCGSDGFTYNSLCELRNQAAIRQDYDEACYSGGSTRRETCRNVLRNERCNVSGSSCSYMVVVDGSCCPVCGGAIEVIVDEDALRDASEFHPDLITTEVFAESLLSASQLQSYPQNCDIDVLLNSIGNLMLIFNAKTRSDARACYDNALVMEILIELANNRSVEGQTFSFSTLPVAYSYAKVGSRATNITQDDLLAIEASRIGLAPTLKGELSAISTSLFIAYYVGIVL